MQNGPIDTPAEADVRFLGYRLEVIGHWDPSPRKVVAAKAISQRLTSIARCALVRPDIADLLQLSCQLLDDFFTTDCGEPNVSDPLKQGRIHAASDNTSSILPGAPSLLA
jgi:hypothetical protein